MTDQPSKMMRDVLDKIEQEKRERKASPPPPPQPAAPVTSRPVQSERSVSPRQMSLLPIRPLPSQTSTPVNTKGRNKNCPICKNLATYRAPHRYHCATCHVFIDLD